MVPNQLIGIIFAIVSIGILAYLFNAGKFTRKTGYIFLVLAVILGFLVFSPMFPVQIQTLILGEEIAGVPFMLPLIMLVVVTLLAMTLGRVFCGYLCPIGAAQELAYSLPGKKYLKGHKKITMSIRGLFFVAVLMVGIFMSLGLVDLLGPGAFFKMDYLVLTFWIFVGILVVSIFVYRPFCRTACPYGVFLSLAASKSMFKIRRNEKCMDCGKCEKVCPTGEAGRDDSKAECYMCNRCVEVCPVEGLTYSKKN
ncbi:MAG: 4Fe-4S binding protein [Thermoplasmata archaeon]|nr:4Fe-4S binding protein [Thermoplasmata archaeon]